MSPRPLHRAALAALLFGALAGAAVEARAAEYHYQSYPVGERALGMAGAYTALGASPISTFYNPAGLAFVRDTRLSVQTGVYGLAGDSTSGGGGFVATDSSQLLTFPSTAALARRVGEDHVVGFAILTPDYDLRATQLLALNVPGTRDDGTPITLRSVSLLQDDRDTTLWLGPGYAWRPHRRFGIGVSMFFTLRDRSLLSKLGVVLDEDNRRAIEVSAKTLHLGLLGQVGVRFEPLDGLYIGATFRTPSARIASRAEGNYVSLDATGALRGNAELTGTQSKLPWRAAFGVAYTVPRTFAVSADLALHGAVAPYDFVEGLEPEVTLARVEKRLVANANVGAEVYLGGYVALRAGFFTNFSARAAPSDAVRDTQVYGLSGVIGGQGDVPDLYGLTFGVGLESARTTLGLGLSYAFGSGESLLAGVSAPRSVRLLLVGISGSYAF